MIGRPMDGHEKKWYRLQRAFLTKPTTRKTHQPKNNGQPRLIARAALPTRAGRFTIYGFVGRDPQIEVIALVHGKPSTKSTPLVRVHAQCFTGDVLNSLSCNCRAQLELSLRKIARVDCGVLLYLPQESRGMGLKNELCAYESKCGTTDTRKTNEWSGFIPDSRNYRFFGQILKYLGATKVRLLSDNPEEVRQLEQSGIGVTERVPCRPRVSRISRACLQHSVLQPLHDWHASRLRSSAL